MIEEVVDKSSGAILFKRDKDSLLLEELLYRVTSLEEENKRLLSRIENLEMNQKRTLN